MMVLIAYRMGKWENEMQVKTHSNDGINRTNLIIYLYIIANYGLVNSDTHYTLPFLDAIFFPQRKVSFFPSTTSLCLVLGGVGVGATVGKGNSEKDLRKILKHFSHSDKCSKMKTSNLNDLTTFFFIIQWLLSLSSSVYFII